MPYDSLDGFFAELLNSGAEVAQILAVGDKPQISFASSRQIEGKEIEPLLQSGQIFKADFDSGSETRIIILIPDNLALALAGSLLGTDKPVSFGSGEKSAVFELFNNIVSRMAVSWGDAIDENITVTSQEILDSSADNPPGKNPAEIESWLEIIADVGIGDEKSALKIYFPAQFVDAAEKKLGLSDKAPEDNMDEETTKEEESVEEATSEKTQDTTPETEATVENPPPEETTEIPAEPKVETPPSSDPGANIQQAQFAQITEDKSTNEDEENRSIDLIMDVPLLISVELGRKDLTIKEILELSPGSLIELNQLAGEPVDLLINGKLFARGEVVVIDENFGIRVTAIISPQERVERIRQ